MGNDTVSVATQRHIHSAIAKSQSADFDLLDCVWEIRFFASNLVSNCIQVHVQGSLK
jgi:hypothetical protein